PTSKMGKSSESGAGTVYLRDDPDDIAKKIRRAVTDTGTEVRYDVAEKPGVSNLLSILGAATGHTPQEAAADYTRYGDLKAATADAVVELLRPIQERYQELAADPGATDAILRKGADKAREVAGPTLSRAQRAIGLLPPS